MPPIPRLLTVDSLLSGFIGAAILAIIQWGREWFGSRKKHKAYKALLDSELHLLWFDMCGAFTAQGSYMFAMNTDVWDSIKADLPNALDKDTLKRVFGAYHFIKDARFEVQTRAERGFWDSAVPLDAKKQVFQGLVARTEGAMVEIEDAIAALGVSSPPSHKKLAQTPPFSPKQDTSREGEAGE